MGFAIVVVGLALNKLWDSQILVEFSFFGFSVDELALNKL